MPQVRYKIYTLSASALMAYAQEDAESGYAFALNAKATEKCKVLTALHEQQDCALFFQALCILHGDSYQLPMENTLISGFQQYLRPECRTEPSCRPAEKGREYVPA